MKAAPQVHPLFPPCPHTALGGPCRGSGPPLPAGAEPLRASGPSNVGLARRVPLTKAMVCIGGGGVKGQAPVLSPTPQNPPPHRLALQRLEVSKERFFRTPRLTPHSCVSGTHQVGDKPGGWGSKPAPPPSPADGSVTPQRPLKWRLALTPQRGPSTDAADSKEEAPPWVSAEPFGVPLF